MFTCKKCDKSLSSKDILVRHLKTCGMNTFGYSCPHCQRKINRKDNFTRHLRSCTITNDDVLPQAKVRKVDVAASTNRTSPLPPIMDETIAASTSRVPPLSSSLMNVHEPANSAATLPIPMMVDNVAAQSPTPIMVDNVAHASTSSGAHGNGHSSTSTATTGYHPRSLKYKDVGAVDLEGEQGVQLLRSAFKCRIASYRIRNLHPANLELKQFLESSRGTILKLIRLQKLPLKIHLEQFSRYILPSRGLIEVKSFLTRNLVFTEDTLEEQLTKLFASVERKSSEFLERESGWVLQKILHLEVNINKLSILRGTSYIDLPRDIRDKRAILNIQNTDAACFKWCILAHLYPVGWRQHPHRVQHYQRYEGELNFQGIDFPVKLSDIPTFEKLNNNISVNVYGLEKSYNSKLEKWEHEVIGPFYLTSSRRAEHVNLLLLSDDDNIANNHYCLIRDMSRLVSSQRTHHEHATYMCDGCLLAFPSQERLRAHNQYDCNHTVTHLPSTDLITNKFGDLVPENILQFQNFDKSMRVPFVAYFDFESLLKPAAGCEPPPADDKENKQAFTQTTHLHVPYSFAYKIKCCYDDSLSIFRKYRGDDAPKKFVEWLEADVKNIYKTYLQPIKPLVMSELDDIAYTSARDCHLCKKPFTDDNNDKVRNHDHLSGLFLGAAHSKCNLNYKIPKFIPAICHNLSGYDTHLFIKDLAEEGADLHVIAQNKERYVSFSKKVLVDKVLNKDKIENVFMKIRFVDSFRFMSSSLDKLAKNLSPDRCTNVRNHFPDKAKFNLIRQKGVFPYSYITSMEKLEETQLPRRSDFYDNLRKEDISETDYKRALEVWNTFDCKTLGEYSDIYLMSDVLLLADIFENFRDVCLENYELDPAQYLTAPGLSWDAMLKSTRVELELLTDIDMVHFLRKGIRGGSCFCVKRKAQANNKYMSNYDPSKPTSFIMYLDATNLYGAAMSQYLPLRRFQWGAADCYDENIIMGLSDTAEDGYIFEVDIEYPSELHEKHNDMPFCPENVVPPNGKCSKLCTTLSNKVRYVIHYRNLKQALANGLKLVKIHRVLKFQQAAWLKSYIDLNTQLRNRAANAFEKDFFKLMNNSVFGKTMESVDKRVDIRLVTSWENGPTSRVGARALLARPHFKSCSIFTENFVAVQMKKSTVLYDKPIYAGFSILDLSKTIMYNFFYTYLKAKYGDKVRLLYTDTDSLVIFVECKDFYEDIKANITQFDTSNYAVDNRYMISVTPSVLGRMKDEYKGKILWEFYGTGAKAYCVDVEGESTKKAKGVKKPVVDKELQLTDYAHVATSPGAIIFRDMSVFRSILHNVYTQYKRKVALSHHDDKRYLIPDTDDTLAWGHKDIPPSQLDT